MKRTDEAPIATLAHYGDIPEKGIGKELKATRDIHNSTKGREKIIRAYLHTAHDYNLFIVPGAVNYDFGEVSKEKLEDMVGHPVDTDGKINILYTNNVTNDDRPMTAWILAHRIGHAVAMADLGKLFGERVGAVLAKLLSRILGEPVASTGDMLGFKLNHRYGLRVEDTLNRLLTMRSARNGQIGKRIDVDGTGEIIAQYIITGKVKLNRLEGFEADIDKAEIILNKLVESLLGRMVGRVFGF